MLNKFIASLDSVSRLSRSIDWVARLAPGLDGDQKPLSDSTGSLVGSMSDLATNVMVEYGMVVDAIPLARCYRVQPDGGGPTIDCAKGMSGTVSPIGAYDADTLTVGTHVRFMRLPNSTSGLIISCEPMYMTDPQKCMGDAICQDSPTLLTESGFHEPFNLGGTQGALSLYGGITDWSGRTPFDSMEIGEFNRSSELGVMLHLDSYMTFMRADEYTGVWAFYWDGLLRAAGQNYQEWAGPSEREVYDDEGETMYYHGIGVYPWEHQGMLTGPYAASTENSADDAQNNYPYYGRIEPTDDDLQPFHRFRTYAGYLGQGQKKMMCAPVLTEAGGGTMEDTLLYSDCYYMPSGLYDAQIMMSGHYAMRTALGFTFAKRPIIPVPKRCEIVTSADGDTPSNYKASDQYGAGDSHKVQATPAIGGAVGDSEKALYRAATITDLHAHLFNWEGVHPFYYHKNDYYLPEESEYDHVIANQEVPSWSDLNSSYQWYLDVPASDTIEYDHRTGGSAAVYNNTAYFTVTDEGGVSIGDGWGSEIRMAGGCIFLECPGDVFVAPGRNFITWGGRDICLRAYNAVDITASARDVRIKAEENLLMLAGNGSGPYGIFIETRGTASSCSGKSLYGWQVVGEGAEHTGIVFKAKDAEIVSWCNNYYVMTKMDDCSGRAPGTSACADEPKAGDIVFDTKGEGDIITRSEFVKHWVDCAVMHAFPDTGGDQVNFFTEDGAIMCGDVYVDGDLLNYGSHLVQADVISCDGHYFSKRGGMVGKADTATACAAINTGHEYEITLQGWAQDRWGIDLDQMWYYEGRPGNVDVVQAAWFDLRVKEDYRSDSFTLWEARWQQMARLNGDALLQWSEPEVYSNDSAQDTYPFPGLEPLTIDPQYRLVDLNLTDVPNGYAEDRGATYESPVTSATHSAIVIDGNYYHIG